MDDLIGQVPVEGEYGWYLSTYWRYEDGTYGVDAFTDGDHDGIEEEDMPAPESIERDWRAYYEHVARTGEDDLGQFLVRRSRPERWEFRLNDSIIGPVFIDARRAGRVYRDPADLPAHVREWLTIQPARARCITAFKTWTELEAAQPGIKRYRWFTVTLDGPRSDAAVRRELRLRARTALLEGDDT